MYEEKIEKINTGDLWLNISNSKENVNWSNIRSFLSYIYNPDWIDWIDDTHTSNIAYLHMKDGSTKRIKYYVGTYRPRARIPFYQCPKAVYQQFNDRFDEMVVLFFRFKNEEGNGGKIINKYYNKFANSGEFNNYWSEEGNGGGYRLNYVANLEGNYVANELKMIEVSSGGN